jgi:tetratricopeptide (TPR) repeat protein
VSAARLRPSWALLLAGACVLSYANGLTGDFTYDDKAIVRDNFRLRSADRVGDIFTTQYFGGPRGTGTAYRPILLLSFAVQWWIHGSAPVPFHVVNVLLHVVATLLVAILFLRVGVPPPAAVGAALLFAVHPLHVEAVTSIVGRGETLSAVFVLTCVRLALRWADGGKRRRWALAGALYAYLLGNLTKESAVVAPVLVFLFLAWSAEGGLFPRLLRAWRRGLAFYVGSAIVLLGVFAARAAILGGALKSRNTGIFELENPLAPLSPLVRSANAAAIFFRYLGRLVLPVRLSADESAWSLLVLKPHDLLFFAAPALLAALCGAAVWRLRDRSVPAVGFLFLVLAALPASNLLFPTGTIFAERLMYLPSAGFCLIAATAVLGAAGRFAEVPLARLAALAALAIAFAGRTVIRNPVWDGDLALFANLVRESPASAKAHYDYAYASAEAGQTRRALEHYARATDIFPRYWDAWAGQGRMRRALGDLEGAEEDYAESLRRNPRYENGFFGLGLVREERGNLTGAEEAYRRGIAANPRSFPLAYRLAIVLSAQSRPEARHAWHRALTLAPDSKQAQHGYAEWLAKENSRFPVPSKAQNPEP